MRLRRPGWDGAAVGLIVLAVAAPVILFAHTLVEFVVMPDELGYVKQAILIGRAEPQLPGDFWFNSWAQLAPLVYSPFYRAFETPTAFDLAHTANALIMASAAVPVWLLARRVLRSRATAVLAAALAVCIPWVGMSGTLMTEPIAYTACCWAMLAITNAVARPGMVADLLALLALAIAFAARTQLILLGAALLVAVLTHELTQPGSGTGRERAGRAWRGHRTLWIVIALAGVAVLAGGGLDKLLGNYIAPVKAGLLPAGTLPAARELLAYVVVGIGILPLPLTAAWCVTAVGRARERDEHAFACLALAVVPLLTLTGGAFTTGFTAGINDRYLFYVVPVLMVGMLAGAASRRRGWLPALVVAGAGTFALVAASQLSQEGASLVSPTMAFHQVLPGPFALGAASAVALAVIAVAARFVPAHALALAVGGSVLAYGVAETQYTLRKVADTQAGASEEFVRQRNWIDRELAAGSRAASVIASYGDGLGTTAVWWDVSFWNKAVERVFRMRGAHTYSQGFYSDLEVDPRTGRIPALDPYRWIVRSAEDARFGLRGSRTVASHAGVSVLEAERPYRAEWLMHVPDSADGELPAGERVRVDVFPGEEAAEHVVVDMRVRPAGEQPQRVELRSGNEVRRVTLPPGNRTQVKLPVDLATGPARIEITTAAGRAPLRLLSVLPA